MVRYACALCALLLFVSLGCSRKPTSTAEVPHLLSHTYTVSVAPFTQPTSPTDLIVGNLPQPQGRISDEDLARLNAELRSVLASGTEKRHYRYLTSPVHTHSVHVHASAQPKGLATWITYGKAHRADLLLVPQVLNWHEREGSKAGVTQSAEVRVEFFLLKVGQGTIMARSVFDEKQRPLTDNFLEIGAFVKRKGAWVSATDLAVEGMQKAKREFGL